MQIYVLDGQREGTLARRAQGKPLTLLIGKYRVGCWSPIGRGTKGYVAYVVEMDRLVFVKDTWRPNSEKITPELERYRELHKHEVKYVAQAVGGGDVYHVGGGPGGNHVRPGHIRTRFQEFDKRRPIVERIKYRVVVETLGLPLQDYLDSFALTRTVFCAFIGAPRGLPRLQRYSANT